MIRPRKVIQWVVGITTLKVAHSLPTLYSPPSLSIVTKLQVLVKRKTTRLEGNTGEYAEMEGLTYGGWCREDNSMRQYSVASVWSDSDIALLFDDELSSSVHCWN
jgi:hypothetical protein